MTTLITYEGKTDTIAGWAKKIGVPYATLSQRFYHGWPTKRALTEPLQTRLGRSPKRPSRAKANMVPTPANTLAIYVRHHNALRRQFNRTLRMFVRESERQMTELNRKLGRNLSGYVDTDTSTDRGVGQFAPKEASDRLLSSTQETT